MKILLTGIFLVCLNTFTGSTFDAITKYSGINNYMWYHYYSIGGSVAICCFIIFLLSQGGLKKHILLEKKEYYFLPVFRGLYFISILIIIFYALQNIPINIFTMLLMTSPFFLLIFAKFILKEKLNLISWIAIIIGFCGVLIVLRPSSSNINIYIFLVIFVAISNALNFTLVSKYSHIASSYGFTFYQYIPLTLFSYIFFFNDPMLPSKKDDLRCQKFLYFCENKKSEECVKHTNWALALTANISLAFLFLVIPHQVSGCPDAASPSYI